jgi:branched-chain amino acid aminotransferase
MASSSGVSFIQANSDGRLHDAREASISPLNRGFLYGDAIYEVWRTYGGCLFAWEEHWERLLRSAAALGMEVPLDPPRLLEEIRRSAKAFLQVDPSAPDLYVRLQVTRGAGSIGLDTGLADHPSWVILVQRLRDLGEPQLERGLNLSLATGLRRNSIRALNPAWKTGNYLNNVLCLREARSRGADEVVMLNEAGYVTEAAVCNLFFVRGQEVVTPPSSAGILEGITRALLLKGFAASDGIAVREADVRPEDLGGFDECFLTSTTRDLAPVRSIDGKQFAVGPGTVTRQIKAAFRARVTASLRHRPELQLYQPEGTASA